MEPIRILIADDHPVFRFGMKSLLNSESEMMVVGEAKTGNEVIALAETLKPDVILMDINMPGIHGIEATRQIVARSPSIKVLMISMMEDDKVVAALRAGARGYLLKGAEGEETLSAIRIVAAGGSIFSPYISDQVIGYMSNRANGGSRIFLDLTDREYEILKLIALGLTNSAIADRLVISPKTVRNHVSAIFDKMHVSNRAEAIAKAHEVGIVSD
jgi:DNA-binding NarL/FixJ family response regulator